MIIDTLENLHLYASLNPLFNDVVEFIQTHDLNALEPGKYTIKGDELFVNIAIATSKDASAAVMETHKNMIDIQIPLDTAESYGYAPLCELPDAPYNDVKDITKYEGYVSSRFVTCDKGMFAIFFPQDGHAPCIALKDTIHKAIFKVKA